MSEENVEWNDPAITGLTEIAKNEKYCKKGTFSGTQGETMELQ